MKLRHHPRASTTIIGLLFRVVWNILRALIFTLGYSPRIPDTTLPNCPISPEFTQSQLSKELSRRTFLKETAFGAFALGAARWVPGYTTSPVLPEETARQLEYFSPHEYQIIEAVAERLIGAPEGTGVGASQIDVAMRADKFLSTADPEIQEQFHQLLTAFNAPLFTFLFDFRFSSFLNMTPDDKDSYIEDWMTSVLGFRRQGFQAFKRVCMSMFYTHSRTWAETGFDGVFFPSEA